MILEQARVVRVSQSGAVLVETDGKKSCSKCEHGAGCGISALRAYFGRHRHRFEASSKINVAAEDQVMLGVQSSALIIAASLMYVMPLLIMLFGVLTLEFIHPDGPEILQVVVAVLGLGCGILIAKTLAAHHFGAGKFEPVIVSRYLSVVESGVAQQK